MLGPAHEGIPLLIKSQRPIRRACDPDPYRRTDLHRSWCFSIATARRNQLAQPQRTRCRQIHAIVLPCDTHRRRQPSRSARQVQQAFRSAVLLHHRDAIEWLECANQNRRRRPFRFAHHVEHEVIAIVEVHVGVSTRQIHRPNPRRQPAKMMSGRITWRIRFILDDAPAHSSFWQLAHHHFADQVPRQRQRVRRKLVPPQPPYLKRPFMVPWCGDRIACLRQAGGALSWVPHPERFPPACRSWPAAKQDSRRVGLLSSPLWWRSSLRVLLLGAAPTCPELRRVAFKGAGCDFSFFGVPYPQFLSLPAGLWPGMGAARGALRLCRGLLFSLRRCRLRQSPSRRAHAVRSGGSALNKRAS